MLTISLFNQFNVSIDGAPVRGLESHRLQCLLSYLLLHRQNPVSRGKIAYLFWPDSNEAQALTNLRNLLHLLRRALPDKTPFFRIDRQTVQWLPEAPVSLDVDSFDRDLNVAASLLPAQPQDACAALASALGHYPGDLLPFCYADWIQPYRDQYRQKFLTAGRQLLDLLDQQGQVSSAIPYAERLLASNPLDESTYRRLMRYYSSAGDYAAAIQTYLRLCDALGKSLAMSPSAESQGLYDQILQHRLGPGTVAIPARLEEDVPNLNLEAAPEWLAFMAAWQNVLGGRAHLLLVEGEAGMGKTRFARRAARWAAANEVTSLSCGLHELDTSLQYAPLIGLLRRLPPESLDPAWKRELALWLPELRSSPETYSLPDWSRTVLYETALQALTRDRLPLLLLIDNLQWCDQGTLEWLVYMLHTAPRLPVLVAATLRPEERTDNPSLDRFLISLYREGRLSRVELQPLLLTETASLAGQVLERTLPPERAAWLHQLSGGNPLYLLEWLSVFQHTLLDPQRDLESLFLPEPVRILVDERLALLGPDARRLLPLAASAGKTFTLTGLLETSQMPLGAVVAALNELAQRRIVVETSPECYMFRYVIFQKGVLHELNSAQWRLLHQQMARLGQDRSIFP